MGVGPTGGLERQCVAQRFAVRSGRFAPVGLERTPHGAESFFVGIAVLRHDRTHALGVREREPKADRRAVVEDVQRVALQSQGLDERRHVPVARALDAIGDHWSLSGSAGLRAVKVSLNRMHAPLGVKYR